MSAAIVGLGLVTPFADTPTEHVFFLRASVPAPPPSPFRLRADGSALHVYYCRWLGAGMPIAQRLTQLTTDAIRQASGPIGAAYGKGERQIVLCLPRERAGVPGTALEAVCSAVAGNHGGAQQFHDDAGAFGALRQALAVLRKGTARVVVVAAADSFVALDALDEHVLHPPSEWDLPPTAPSEGAAAIALMEAHEARRNGVPILAYLGGASTARGESNDDNDEPVDGSAMTVALRALPPAEPVGSVFGPFKVDLLRQDEWRLAVARLAKLFDSRCTFTCLESLVGRLGAASGLASLVYGVALHRHRAAPTVEASAAPFYTWAVSPDGTRGTALVSAREP
jgi:hypothetical protein